MKKCLISKIVLFSLLLLQFLLYSDLYAADATLTWEAPTTNTDGSCVSDHAGYKVYYGTTSGNYTNTDDIGNIACADTGMDAGTGCGNIYSCSYTVTGLSEASWFFSVTSYDTAGNESSYSNETGKVISAPVLNSATTYVDPTHIDIEYSEPVFGADTITNYSSDNGLEILAVTDLGGNTFRLTTTQQSPGTTYTITATNITNSDGIIIDPANDTVSFVRTENVAPTTPSLNSPVSGTEVTSIWATLSVNASTDGDGDPVTYTFEISKADDFSNIFASASGITDNGSTADWTTPTLDDNTTFYWRVIATDGDLDSSNMTSSFFVNTLNDNPTDPVISVPSNGSEVSSLTPVLEVTNSSDIDNDTLTYEFEVDITDAFNSGSLQASGTVTEGSSGTTSWTPATLTDNTIWYWRSRAKDWENGYSNWINGSFFVNTSNDAPSTPSINSPANGSETTDTTPIFTINNSSDLDGDTISYTLEVDYVNTFDSPDKKVSPSITEGTGTTSWTLTETLNDNTTYYWRAKAGDGMADSLWMNTASVFINTMNEAPTTPLYSSPSNNGEVNTLYPQLTVIPATDADNDILTYEYEIYGDSSLSDLIESAADQGTSWTLSTSLTGGSTYYWRVKAKDEHNAYSDWSEAYVFTVNVSNAAPTAPTAISPADGKEISSKTPDLIVGRASDQDGEALTYEFELYSDSRLENLVVSNSGVAETYDTVSWTVNPPLATDSVYYWRARASDGNNYGSWTNTATFAVTSGTITGDIDYNGMVDGYDLIIMSLAYGSISTDAAFNPFCDLNDDGVINDVDLSILSTNFGGHR